MKNVKPLRLFLGLILCTSLIFSCGTPSSEDSKKQEYSKAKFEPKENQTLLFIGQEMEAIGGLDDYNDGYLDHFDKPAGFTMYTNIAPGDTSFGYVQVGLDGIWRADNWGDSPSFLDKQIKYPDFEHMALAVGLSIVNHEQRIADGEHDGHIFKLGEYYKSLAPRPVFLRIGYEFDGAWNHYDKEGYKGAFRRIHDTFTTLGVDNVAFVWQSTGWGSNFDELGEYYPGDHYVDWCGYSHFVWYYRAKPMLDFAEFVDKPVFIAEATPMITNKNTSLDLAKLDEANLAWDQWFEPFFRTIHQYPRIKAISYINCNWKTHRMWYGETPFAALMRDCISMMRLKTNGRKKSQTKNSFISALGFTTT